MLNENWDDVSNGIDHTIWGKDIPILKLTHTAKFIRTFEVFLNHKPRIRNSFYEHSESSDLEAVDPKLLLLRNLRSIQKKKRMPAAKLGEEKTMIYSTEESVHRFLKRLISMLKKGDLWYLFFIQQLVLCDCIAIIILDQTWFSQSLGAIPSRRSHFCASVLLRKEHVILGLQPTNRI